MMNGSARLSDHPPGALRVLFTALSMIMVLGAFCTVILAETEISQRQYLPLVVCAAQPEPSPSDTPTPTLMPTATATVTHVPLRPGDILTRDSASLSLPTHDALYVGGDVIIDSLPEGGVQLRSLTGFRKDAHNFLVVQRLVDGNGAAALGAVAYAVSKIGTPYDYQYFGGKDTDDRMYCSELVWRAYLPQGYDLDSNGGAWVWPSEIIRSDLLVDVAAGLKPTLISSH